MIQPNEEYQPSWHALLRDVHDVDKRITILEATQVATSKALDELRADSKETNRTLHQVRDAVVGWKSSLATIIMLSGGLATAVFFVLGKVLQ
jgi:hypothetical protein